MKKYNDIKGISYLLDKNKSIDYYISYTLNRTLSTFSYRNLPDSIPEKELERILQTNGHCIVAEVDGTLYAFAGSFSGLPNVYGLPVSYQVNNVALNLNKTYDIDKDCILIRNDTMLMGLVPLINRYAILLTENDISIRTGDILLRMISVISAPDERTKKSAESYISKIVNGDLSVIGENAFLDGIKMQHISNLSHAYMTQFIEIEQYLKGSMYNELGINANYNMKRGNITTGETLMDADLLNTFTDNMLFCRKEAIEKINDKYGLEIEVNYSPTWDTIKGKDIQNTLADSSTKQIVDNAVDIKAETETGIVQNEAEEPENVIDESEVTEEAEEPENEKLEESDSHVYQQESESSEDDVKLESEEKQSTDDETEDKKKKDEDED